MILAFKDLKESLSRMGLWARLAVTDMQQTYKRSIMGLLWMAFAFGLFIGVKAIIFGSFAPGEPGEFYMWLTIGLWLFWFLQQSVVDGSNVFIVTRNWLLATDLPLTGFIFQTTIRGLIKFVYQSPIVILMVVYSKWKIPMEAWWALPAFFVLVINAV